MELALFFASFFFFSLGFPSPALLLRCALAACQRFSPRASLALSGVAALCGGLASLCRRGGLACAPANARARLIPSAFAGGALGRALLLMFTAHSASSLSLSRLQAVPLLLLGLLALLPQGGGSAVRERTPGAFLALGFFCGVVDGFFGAGGAILLGGLCPARIVRRRFSPTAPALLLTVCAQAGALLLTICAGAPQVFPARMVALLAVGSALGALAAEGQKERGPLAMGAGAALRAYLVLSALAGVEQAYA